MSTTALILMICDKLHFHKMPFNSLDAVVSKLFEIFFSVAIERFTCPRSM